MTRTVLDTNAIVSALLFNDSAPGRALIKALHQDVETADYTDWGLPQGKKLRDESHNAS